MFTCLCVKAQTRVTFAGQVVDSISGEPLEFVNIAEKGTSNGTMSNTQGQFSLMVKSGSNVAFSCLGYAPKEINAGNVNRRLGSGRNKTFVVKLCPTDVQLGEVVVKHKREKYRRKGNPAVELARNIIAHKHDRNISLQPNYQMSRYDCMTYSFNNFGENWTKRWTKRFPFIVNYVDTAKVTRSPILPIMQDEQVERHYYRNTPSHGHTTVIEGQRHAGMDDMLPTEMVSLLKKEVFPEIDLTDDNIYLYRKKFVSPISSFGITFYRYYILDSLVIDGKPYIDLGFAPTLPQSFGFVGHLLVARDSTYMIKRAELNIPPDINLNFVRNLHSEFEYDMLEDSTVVVARKSFDTELNVTSGSLGLQAHRDIRYYDFSRDVASDSIFDGAPLLTILRDESMPPLPERSVHSMMEQMRQVRWYRNLEIALGWVFKGFVPIDNKREENAKFLLGQVNALASWNTLEHARFHLGGMTTGNLSHYWFLYGFGAYGIKDHKFKYYAQSEFSFRKKKMYPTEFPMHSLRLYSQYDTRELSVETDQLSRDNFLHSMRRPTEPYYTYLQKHGLTYTIEFWNHLSLEASVHWQRESQSRLGRDFFLPGSGFMTVDHYDLGIGTLKLRWAPKEAFAQMHTRRVRVDSQHPIFTITHRYAKKGLLGSDFDFQSTEFEFEKRFWLNVLGYANVRVMAGKVWTEVPYTQLFMPNVNTGYFINRNSFSQMDPLEFVYDQYAQWNLEWRLQGLILGNIPLVKRLKWREIISFNGVYGDISDANRNNILLTQSTYGKDKENKFNTFDNTPYMELGVGIDNIFKVLRVEYTRRLTHMDHPGISKHGVKVAVSINF